MLGIYLKRIIPFLFIIAFTCSGCIVVPFVEGVSKIGLGKNDREALLPQSVQNFQDLIYWNKFQAVGALIKEDVRSVQIKEIMKKYKGYRLVETKTDFLDFNEDSTRCVASVTAKRFKVPFYIVEDYAEDQVWEFTVSDGWKFVSAEPSKADIKENHS